ncbi:cytochrome P450 [Halocatena salina]|uniref:Cytochrome P450 n=1 Tax=Halocatena salina TaxID=2934340 RepID=A0A8U0A8Q4_9EURY|nr:cytochrome P450 [Halocatena salina]UPM45216.1 cytochrome P450 [Halocatena salina]
MVGAQTPVLDEQYLVVEARRKRELVERVDIEVLLDRFLSLEDRFAPLANVEDVARFALAVGPNALGNYKTTFTIKLTAFPKPPISMEMQANPNPELDEKLPTEIDSIEAQRNPYSWYKEMRETNPIRYDENRKRWDVFRYDDVERILTNHETFISSKISDIDPVGAFGARVFGDTDLPDHQRQRGAVDDFFRPGKLRDFRPELRTKVDKLLDQVLETGSAIDVANELSTPITVWSITEILGVPSDHTDQLTELVTEVLDTTEAEPMTITVDGKTFGPGGHDVMEAYFKYLLDKRARDPKDGVISRIAQADDLSEEEQYWMTIFLYSAGVETSAKSIDIALWTFAEEDVYSQLRDGKINQKLAFEESLRYRTALQSMAGRSPVEDVEINGTIIPEGDQICLWVGSANRDERKFDDPDEFDPKRKPNPHISFGKGLHYCLGAPLALLEGDIVIEAITDRVKSIECAVEFDELQPGFNPRIYGFDEVPMHFYT